MNRRASRLRDVTLDEEDVEAIAVRVAQIINPQTPAVRLLSAAEVAAALGVSRAWVYDHASELGGFRLGEEGRGQRRPLRFDVQRVLSSLAGSAELRTGGSRSNNRTRSSASSIDLIDYDGAA